MSVDSMVLHAGEWFRCSGIQEASGGVARYYRTDLERNHPVSTEITGYALSTLLELGAPEAARRAAGFLVSAWDGAAMPFEMPAPNEPKFSYFFDCGIIVRGLLAAWRATGDAQCLDAAAAVGRSMAADFADGEGAYHPILRLPEKRATERDPLRWSQSPGCYQLKAALGWLELFTATGDTRFCQAYESLLVYALETWRLFLPGHTDPHKVVDRLHAFLYFLEGLLPRAGDEPCRAALSEGIRRVEYNLNKMAPEFERSDVYAQLLRIRVFADWTGAVPIDKDAAGREATKLSAFQVRAGNGQVEGGFYFGRKGRQWLPYVNPVSTGFAAQALDVWARHCRGAEPLRWNRLI